MDVHVFYVFMCVSLFVSVGVLAYVWVCVSDALAPLCVFVGVRMYGCVRAGKGVCVQANVVSKMFVATFQVVSIRPFLIKRRFPILSSYKKVFSLCLSYGSKL